MRLILALTLMSGCAALPQRAALLDFAQCAAADDQLRAYLEDPAVARDIADEARAAASRVVEALGKQEAPAPADLQSLAEADAMVGAFIACLPE